MVENNVKKRTDQLIAVGAIGLGVYALLRGTGILGSNEKGEGSIGGSDDPLTDDQGFRTINNDPNTIPNQITAEESPSYEGYYPPSIEPNVEPIPPDLVDAIPSSRYRSSDAEGIDSQTSGLFGTGISTGEAGLGLAGFLPSVFTKTGERAVSKNTDSIFKRIIPEAVEETPLVGKKLAQFAYGNVGSVDNTITSGLTKPTAEMLAQSTQGSLNIGVQYGAKTGLKEIGKKSAKVAVGAVPFIGTAAGAEFDVAVDARSRPLAYTANALGDFVGGALGIFTTPVAATGIGAVVPVAVGIGGQVATESLVYGIAGTLSGGSGAVNQAAVDNAISMQNQGTFIPTESPYTFQLINSGKDYAKYEEEDIKPERSFFDIFGFRTPQNEGAPANLYSSTISTPVLGSSSSGSRSVTQKSIRSSADPTIIGTYNKPTGEMTGIKFNTTQPSESAGRSSQNLTLIGTSSSGQNTYSSGASSTGNTGRIYKTKEKVDYRGGKPYKKTTYDKKGNKKVSYL